jgi:hypothetical protein
MHPARGGAHPAHQQLVAHLRRGRWRGRNRNVSVSLHPRRRIEPLPTGWSALQKRLRFPVPPQEGVAPLLTSPQSQTRLCQARVSLSLFEAIRQWRFPSLRAVLVLISFLVVPRRSGGFAEMAPFPCTPAGGRSAIGVLITVRVYLSNLQARYTAPVVWVKVLSISLYWRCLVTSLAHHTTPDALGLRTCITTHKRQRRRINIGGGLRARRLVTKAAQSPPRQAPRGFP